MIWESSVTKVLIKLSRGDKNTVLNLKQIMSEGLETIVNDTQSHGKTPQNTLRRCLQTLRDMGVVQFLGHGKYILNDIQDLMYKQRHMSKGEKLVKMALDVLEVNYEQEKTFDTLKHKARLRCDFYIEMNGRKYVIEFDGKQHSTAIKRFGGQYAFAQTQLRDAIKNKWCAQNNVKLLRISKLNYEFIKARVKDTLNIT